MAVKQSIVFCLLILLLVPLPAISDHDEIDSSLVISPEGSYDLEIIASNFKYQIIDLNEVSELQATGMNSTEARNQASYYNRIESLDYGRDINLHLKSSNGSHGLFIDELNVDVFLDAPSPGDKYGEVVERSSVLPSVDTTIRAYCNIFCGEGHANMDFEMVVGHGSNFGNQDIDVLGDWRVWLLFGIFAVATGLIVVIAVVKPGSFLQRNDQDE